MDYSLTKKAKEVLDYAIYKGIIGETYDNEGGIIQILNDQEIVSFCNKYGCVSFDQDDLLIVEPK